MSDVTVPGGSGLNIPGGVPSASVPSPPSTILSQVSPGVDLQWFQDHFRPHFDKWVFKAIERLLSKEEPLTAFIVMPLAIDYLAGFWWGDSTQGKVAAAYKGFIDQYFPSGRYDANGLYDSLRNGLVHMFTIKGRQYALTHEHPDLHLKADTNGQIFLNAEDFFEDLVRAKESYFDAVESSQALLQKVVKRYKREGFLGHIPINMP